MMMHSRFTRQTLILGPIPNPKPNPNPNPR